jgi:ATP-dependent Clp protease ATP-binding subunit ClpA
MFERFTESARVAVTEAQAHARRLGHDHVGTEHLLLALLGSSDAAADVLRAAGLTAEGAEAEIGALVGPSSTELDRAALAALGIDLDRVREVVDAAFGEGALSLDGPAWQPGRRRRRRVLPGLLRFTPRAKKSIELALREAIRLRQGSIGTEHLALGILREGRGLACQVLVRHGASLPSLRAALEQALRPAA